MGNVTLMLWDLGPGLYKVRHHWTDRSEIKDVPIEGKRVIEKALNTPQRVRDVKLYPSNS